MPVTGTVGEKVFEMKDVLQWLQEEAEAKGELGWSDNFPNNDEIFAEGAKCIAPPLELHDDEDFPDEAEIELMRVELREEGLQRLERAERQHYMSTDTMKPLMVHTEREVNKSLIRHGVSKRQLGNSSLRQKVVDLRKLENPQIKNYIRVRVDAHLATGNNDIFLVKLPIEAELNDIYNLLKTSVDIHIAGSGTKQEKGGLWKYQLLSHDMRRVINKSSVYLKTDDDYRTLVDIVKDNGKKTPVAILTQPLESQNLDDFSQITCMECAEHGEIAGKNNFDRQRRDKQTPENREVIWDDSNWEMPLDKDGKPYFDSYDPKRIHKIMVKLHKKNLEIGHRAIEADLPLGAISTDDEETMR